MKKFSNVIIPDEELFADTGTRIVVVPDEVFCGKEDPTQFSPNENTIMVKASFDMQNDPNKWLIHERAHAVLNAKGVNQYCDDEHPYPTNEVEVAAYSTQLFHLIKAGVTAEMIRTDPQYNDLKVRFKRYPIMQTYFDTALAELERQNSASLNHGTEVVS